MPPKKLSVQEIKAVAETAITARHAADTAKTAFDAKPDDASLKAAWETAESTATEAKSKADALSQQTLTPDQIAKHKKKIAIMQSELRDAGALNDDIDDDTDLDDDDDKPITRGDLKRMEVERASQSAEQMAAAITDPALQQSVKAALGDIKPSGNAEADFQKAVAIANIGKNSQVLQELGRTPPRVQHHSGSGAPPRKPEGEFVPTAEESRYMRAPFNLSKEAILKARPQ